MGEIISASLKSLKWTMWNIVFGLLPAWLALIFSKVDAKDVLYEGQRILIKEGALMFFSVAVITAITIDFKMAIDSMRPEEAKRYHGITTWNNWASFIVVFISTIVYAHYYGVEIGEKVLANITIISYVVFAFTIINVLILKFYQIYYRPF